MYHFFIHLVWKCIFEIYMLVERGDKRTVYAIAVVQTNSPYNCNCRSSALHGREYPSRPCTHEVGM